MNCLGEEAEMDIHCAEPLESVSLCFPDAVVSMLPPLHKKAH